MALKMNHLLKYINQMMRFKRIAFIGFFLVLAFFFIKLLISITLVINLLSMLPIKHNVGVNILLVGTDHVEGTRRSDAISVIHINNDQTKIRALSIPRDTRVNIENIGVSKINHAYAYGGIKLLKKTVSNFLSIPIHNYVILNAEGIKTLIDEVGGVTVQVDEDMNYTDFAGDLHINFESGENHLNGDDLLKYVRFRNNSKGDIGRIERQQEVSKLLFDKFFRFKSIIISPKLIRIFFKSVKTDLGIGQMSKYLNLFLKKRDQLSMKFLTVPGSVRLIDGVSYWRPDIVYLDNLISKTFVDFNQEVQIKPKLKGHKEERAPFITSKQITRVNQQLDLDKNQKILEQSPFVIEVLNGNGTAGLASKTAQFLRNNKIVVSKVSNSQSFNYKDTLIVDWKGNIERSLKLAKLLRIEPSNIVVYDRQEKPLDITLVLGKNWTSTYLEGLTQ